MTEWVFKFPHPFSMGQVLSGSEGCSTFIYSSLYHIIYILDV